MKSNNKRNSGLLYQKVLKKAPLYEPMRIRERPKRIAQRIELPSFETAPRYKVDQYPLKPMDPVYEPKLIQPAPKDISGFTEHQEMIRQKNEAL